MRGPRIRESGAAYYHMVSRVVDRRMIFDANEKERMRRTLRATEGFSGVEVLTYALLDNHFHLLLHVPARGAVSDEEFGVRLRYLYDATLVGNLLEEVRKRREEGQSEAAEAIKAPFVRRMYDLSEFAKTLKQRVSQSYNRRHGRKGTLWEERFKSILVQGQHGHGALSTIAAYIDLNPVRAGLVEDPKAYRFSGYGEAVGGSRSARLGMERIMGCDWPQAATAYRQLLYTSGAAEGLTGEGRPLRPGIDAAKVKEVLAAGGELPVSELLRCRVRYFTDGVALGTQVYVDDVFARYRSRFGKKRQTGARPMKGGFVGLFTARRLRLDVITVPAGG